MKRFGCFKKNIELCTCKRFKKDSALHKPEIEIY